MSAWISLNDNNDLGGTRSDLKKENGKRSITADAAKGGQVEGNFSAFTAAVSRRNSPCDWREGEGGEGKARGVGRLISDTG